MMIAIEEASVNKAVSFATSPYANRIPRIVVRVDTVATTVARIV
jgi:hypothetical protein